MLDVDGDGAITHEEYLARVGRVASAMGRDAHPVVAASRAAHEAVFRDMDANGDGRVTFEEYRTWVGHEAFERSCRRWARCSTSPTPTPTGTWTAPRSPGCARRRGTPQPMPERRSTPSTPTGTG
ncbi:EF-hand domain-containing protein [Streptomyces nogalater]